MTPPDPLTKLALDRLRARLRYTAPECWPDWYRDEVRDHEPLATVAQRARALELARRALEPEPSRLFVAGASFLVLVFFGVGLGILFAAGRVVYCAIAGCV
jgi:hypothetical protein